VVDCATGETGGTWKVESCAGRKELRKYSILIPHYTRDDGLKWKIWKRGGRGNRTSLFRRQHS